MTSEAVTEIMEAHERIVGELRAENAKLSEALDRWPLIRDMLKLKLRAALARVAELETKLAELEKQKSEWVRRAEELGERCDAARARAAELEKQEPVAWLYRGTYMGDQLTLIPLDHYWRPKYCTEEHDYIKGIPLYAVPPAQAQHSVPEGWRDTLAEAVAALNGQAEESLAPAIHFLIAEREKQLAHGYTAAHDDAYTRNELAHAAVSYALDRPALHNVAGNTYRIWPWAPEHWKPGSPAHNRITAAALLIADAERIMRATGENVC
ncbi:hypothetical protein ACSEQ4_11960 [Pseudomonas aeruginosa]